MKKLLIVMSILLLITATTMTKNSTKKLDKEIYRTKENIRVLEDKYELVLLDYNFLTSPKKLIEYQKMYFENELVQKDVQNLSWIKINNEEIQIDVIANNEWKK